MRPAKNVSEIDRNFARRLRQVRTQHGISQEALNDRIRREQGLLLGPHAIYAIENARRLARLFEAVAIATTLDTSIDRMLHPDPTAETQLAIAEAEAARAEQSALAANAHYQAAVRRLGAIRLMSNPRESSTQQFGLLV